MNRHNKSTRRGGKPQIARLALFTLLLSTLALTLAAPVPVSAGAILPPLGTAGSFGVLGGSAVTNTGPTTVMGDLGVSPGSAVSGFPPGIVIGTIHAGDAVAAQAQNDANTAYNNAAGQACDFDLTGQDLGGLTLIPGVYCFASSAQLTGQLTLNGQGNSNSVFIFKIGSTLTTASNAGVSVINGAQACRVFWQVGSSATLGTNTSFQGNILAQTSITLNTGSSTNTGLYALNGAVTLDTNDIEACAFVVGPTNTTTATITVASTSTATVTATSTALPVTNTSTAAATNTPAIVATNTTTSSATNTPAPGSTSTPRNTVTPRDTVAPEDTATSTALPTSISTALPSATPLDTPIANPTNTITQPVPTMTQTQTLATQTPGGQNTPTQTPTSPSGTATETATVTETPTVGPPVPPFLPPTGGDRSWLAPFFLLFSALLLAVGVGLRKSIPAPAPIRDES